MQPSQSPSSGNLNAEDFLQISAMIQSDRGEIEATNAELGRRLLAIGSETAPAVSARVATPETILTHPLEPTEQRAFNFSAFGSKAAPATRVASLGGLDFAAATPRNSQPHFSPLGYTEYRNLGSETKVPTIRPPILKGAPSIPRPWPINATPISTTCSVLVSRSTQFRSILFWRQHSLASQ